MAEHPYDDDQLRAVGAGGNVVVAAGAGSGKTTVLAGRYLRLVREGAAVPSILTLTFTRKAAAEMHVRIHRLLTEHADEPVVREQLTLFDQARISTLDSFCSRLARNDAPRFGLPLSFSVDQEGLRKRAESFALQFILEKRLDPALKTLIAANGFETVWKEFFASYAVRELRIADPPDHEADFSRQEEYCRQQAAEIFSRLDALYGQMGEIARDAAASSKTLAEAARIAEEWPDPDELIARSAWEDLLDLAGRKLPKKPGSNVKNPDLVLLRDLIEKLRPLQEQAASLTAVLCYGDVYRGIAGLMDEFTAGWNNLKRSRGLVSFGDVVSMAVSLLKESRELRSYYKAQFRHIMIDEFQDNNEIQKELLYLLAEKPDRFSPGIPDPEDLEEGKLFFVGDEKQSIYRFRGADVSVFKRLSRELGRDGIELGTNYRSHPGLISFFNSFFPPVFSSEDELKDFEAEFRPLTGRKTREGDTSPEIRLHYLDDSGDDGEDAGEYLSAVESEAFEAARLIRDAVDGRGLQLSDARGMRAPAWEDFALLLRSTGNQIVYERIFRRFGIPYTTENIRTLFLEAPVNDIYAALQCCVYPEDRMAYAVYLRSFFVNLSDDALLAELLEERLPFEGPSGGFTPEEAEKYRLGGDIHFRLREMIDRLPHREVLRFLWYEAGYRYNLLQDPAWHGYLEFYEYLLALADKSWDAGESMALFLDFLRENLGDYKKLEEIEILRTREQGVRIMTIHKSKGLEFPIVLLASTGQGSSETGKRAPYFVDTEFGLTVNMVVPGSPVSGKRLKPNPFYERGLELSRQMEAAELKRLLYVACTRAEQHLVMLGYSPRRKSANLPSLLDLIFAGLGCSVENPDSPYVRPFFPVSGDELHRLGTDSPGVGDRRELLTEYYRRTQDPFFEMPDFHPVLSVSRLNQTTAASSPRAGTELGILEIDPLIREREELFGTLVHRVLEGIITGKSPAGIDSLLAGFTAPETEALLSCAEELAERFWNSPSRRKLIPDGVPLHSEVPFTLALESGGHRHLVEGVIDLYADLGEEIICVDFKTNRSRIPGEYAMQMWLYRKALEKLCGKPVRSFLLYVREGLPREELSEFKAEALDELISAVHEKN